MSQPIWQDFVDAEQMSAAAAAHVPAVIAAAIGERGRACPALAGGKTPIPAFERLSQMRGSGWDKVVLLPTDKRLVAPNNELSKLYLIQSLLGSTGAKIVPLTWPDRLSLDAAADHAEHVLGPLDLLWLGMGADEHTRSILPGRDFRHAMKENSDRLALAVMPDPLAARGTGGPRDAASGRDGPDGEPC